MLYSYSIVPLTESGFYENCNDIRLQYEEGIAFMPLFKMVLVPEGNPVWKKPEDQCRIYARYRDELSKYGVETGVLIQASLGHGYPLVKAPFQQLINLTDGNEANAYCPEDSGFIEYFKEAIGLVARAHPRAIMLDDDVRIVMRPGRGCACPLHLSKLKERTGRDMSREELWEYVNTHSDNDELTLEFLKLQTESLVSFVCELRDVIDSVDPTIQGINCTSGDECDSVVYTNPVFAGKGNPTMVRVPNGTYVPESARSFSDIMRRAVVSGTKLKKAGIDIILAETDTIPFNRYGKNARYLHAQYTASILDGLMGAKHWITRFCEGELASGKAYRDILKNNRLFYERLRLLASEIRWAGVNSVFIEQDHHVYSKKGMWRYHKNDWIKCVLERMGIPFYFAEKNDGAAFLEGDIVGDMTDAELKSVFEGSIFVDGEAAADIIERGYGHMLGVSVCDAQKIKVDGESFDGTLAKVCTKQKNYKIICPDNDKTQVLSHNYAKKGVGIELVSPAVTAFERPDGKLSVVYCGSPTAELNYMEGFAFLNETRKKQFVSLFKRVEALPVYYDGDCEICLRAGYLKDETLLVSVYNLSYDPLETLDLYLENSPEEIRIINSDGSDSVLSFEEKGEKIYSVKTRVEPLYPVILLIK